MTIHTPEASAIRRAVETWNEPGGPGFGAPWRVAHTERVDIYAATLTRGDRTFPEASIQILVGGQPGSRGTPVGHLRVWATRYPAAPSGRALFLALEVPTAELPAALRVAVAALDISRPTPAEGPLYRVVRFARSDAPGIVWTDDDSEALAAHGLDAPVHAIECDGGEDCTCRAPRAVRVLPVAPQGPPRRPRSIVPAFVDGPVPIPVAPVALVEDE